MVGKISSTSAFIISTSVTPFTIKEYLRAGKSSQPQRRGRPVVEPNSFPCLRMRSPVSSDNSVGKGLLPQREGGGQQPNYCAGARRYRIGTRHVRVASKVNIEQRTLRSFRQNALPLLQFVIEKIFAVDEAQCFQMFDCVKKFLLQRIPFKINGVSF